MGAQKYLTINLLESFTQVYNQNTIIKSLILKKKIMKKIEILIHPGFTDINEKFF